MPNINPLNAMWKWLGAFMIAQAITLFYFLATGRTGINGEVASEGVQISVALVAAIVLSFSLAMFMFIHSIYLHRNYGLPGRHLWPPTHFEEDNHRDIVVTRIMVTTYYLLSFATLFACLYDYRKSIVTKWRHDNWDPLASSFWSSRINVYLNDDNYNGLYGIYKDGWEYIPYVTDGLLLLSLLALLASFIRLVKNLRISIRAQ